MHKHSENCVMCKILAAAEQIKKTKDEAGEKLKKALEEHSKKLVLQPGYDNYIYFGNQGYYEAWHAEKPKSGGEIFYRECSEEKDKKFGNLESLRKDLISWATERFENSDYLEDSEDLDEAIEALLEDYKLVKEKVK